MKERPGNEPGRSSFIKVIFIISTFSCGQAHRRWGFCK